jgi:hypothetical protein
VKEVGEKGTVPYSAVKALPAEILKAEMERDLPAPLQGSWWWLTSLSWGYAFLRSAYTPSCYPAPLLGLVSEDNLDRESRICVRSAHQPDFSSFGRRGLLIPSGIWNLESLPHRYPVFILRQPLFESLKRGIERS